MITMPKPPASIKSTMVPSWDLINTNTDRLKKHYIGLIYLLLLPTLVVLLGSVLIGNITKLSQLTSPTSRQELGYALSIIGIIWGLINLGPSTYYLLQAAKDKATTVSDNYRAALRLTPRLFLFYIVYALLIIIGLILFIIPGIYVFKRYYLGAYYLVDRDLTIRETFKQSAADSKRFSGAIWGIIGVWLVFSIIASGIGNLPFIGVIIGQLVTYGCIFLPALRYHEIKTAKA